MFHSQHMRGSRKCSQDKSGPKRFKDNNFVGGEGWGVGSDIFVGVFTTCMYIKGFWMQHCPSCITVLSEHLNWQNVLLGRFSYSDTLFNTCISLLFVPQKLYIFFSCFLGIFCLNIFFMHHTCIIDLITQCYIDLICKERTTKCHPCCPILCHFEIK